MKATADNGQRYTLVEREVIGEEPCPGAAHANAHIDNCMLCAPNWGTCPKLAPVSVVDATHKGLAVPCGFKTVESREELEAMRKDGTLTQVHVTKKTRSATSSFYAWVKSSV